MITAEAVTMTIVKEEMFLANFLCVCGMVIGRVYKNDRGFTFLRPANAPNIIIFGDANIICPNCGNVKKWYWNEFAMKRILSARAKSYSKV